MKFVAFGNADLATLIGRCKIGKITSGKFRTDEDVCPNGVNDEDKNVIRFTVEFLYFKVEFEISF